MRLPKYFSWIARNDAKQIILNIQAELTAHSAMVMGEVMQVAIYLLVIILAMKFNRGYIEYIDIENPQAFEDE